MMMQLLCRASMRASMHRRWRSVVGVLCILPVLAGCTSAPLVPIPTLQYRSGEAPSQRSLLVLLRGLGADNTVFEEEGIIEEIRKRNLPFDVVAPDAHYGYYQSLTFEKRLKEDIIDPARREGYRQIWLAGFSMGGLGCLFYMREYPGDVDGVLLSSPFLGWRPILNEIKHAGGLDSWSKTTDEQADYQRLLWSWVKTYDFNERTPVWLGYGENDVVTADGPAMLAARLPMGHAFSVPGNHTVATLKTIILRHLDMLVRDGRVSGK